MPELPYGERVISWNSVWDRLYPEDVDYPHDDAAAAEMHRLRGLVMAQAAETEAVLGAILRLLNPSTKVRQQPAGALLRDVKALLPAGDDQRHRDALALVHQAVERRNHAVHSPVYIGSSWVPYATGGGHWEPVISLMRERTNLEEYLEGYNERDLLADLALQQQATAAAVKVLHDLTVDLAVDP